MEEAEVLADRIAVIADGQMRCIGTSLYLKNNYGGGYKLNLICNPSQIDYTRAKIREIIPSCKVIDDSGGSLLISIPLLNQ